MLDVSSVTSALLCGHVMSRCDTVSYPFRRGKKKVMSAAQDITVLTTYGDTDGMCLMADGEFFLIFETYGMLFFKRQSIFG